MRPAEVIYARELLGLSQGEFAILLGVQWLTVSKWEHGKTKIDGWRAGLLTLALEGRKRMSAQDGTVPTWIVQHGPVKTLAKLIAAGIHQ